MDDKKCGRSTFPHSSSGNRIDSFTDRRYTAKKKQRSCNERKSQGDIIYVKNPLFRNVTLRKLQKLEENSDRCELVSKNFAPNNTDDNYCLDSYCRNLLSSQYNFLNSKPQEVIKNAGLNTSRKSRREGTKARAEIRRDTLINESSDEDYSPVNSSNDLRSASQSYSKFPNMDDAYNRRTRSARTERYFRRLSTKEDGFYDNASRAGVNCNTRDPAINQDGKLSVGKGDTLPLNRTRANNLGDRSPNLLFIDRYDCNLLNNPIYKISGADSPAFHNKRCLADKAKSHTGRKDVIENQAYRTNIEYNKARTSDPGGSALFDYRNNKSPRAIDRVQYVEPEIFNYQHPQQVYPQNKLLIDSGRHVRRSYSFQSELPREYETRNNISVTARRTPTKLGRDSRNERKWIDSIISSASTTSNRSLGNVAGDFERREFDLPKESSELRAGDRNLRNSTALSPTYDNNCTNLSSPAYNEDKIPVKKRSSKDLGKELSELEKMYTSLRLSDDNLLERAEERCIEEFSLKGQSQALTNELSKYHSSNSSSESILDEGLGGEKHSHDSSEAHVINDDMAYRKMQTKKMPALSETQNSLSQISYLLASSAMILDKTEYPDFTDKVAKEEPNITKDDMVYRNLHYANNVLKVIEPQPPFGIPLRPATPSTNSNYLCSSPVALKSPPLKYVPESEPNLITDDLAFRNLRKDAPKTPPSLSEDNSNECKVFLLKNDLDESLDDDQFVRKKKKAVRSLSANLYGLIKEVNNLELNIK